VAADEGANLEVTGSILEYKKGSGWLRFFIGFGAGNAVVNTELRLVDASSGKLLFSGNFKQKVSGWGETGDATWKRIAKDFAKALEKQNKKLIQESNT
jgi:curli biogenesis system outer membrane secretion channel CsgG